MMKICQAHADFAAKNVKKHNQERHSRRFFPPMESSGFDIKLHPEYSKTVLEEAGTARRCQRVCNSTPIAVHTQHCRVIPFRGLQWWQSLLSLYVGNIP